MGIAVFLVLAVVAVGAIAYFSYRARQERIQGFRILAAQLGLTYAAEDPFGTLDEPFPLFGKGEGRGIDNMVSGTWQGLEVRAFDYWFYTETTDSKGNTSRSYSRFDCVMLPVEAACSPLTIEHENFFTRLADHLAMHDIEFESDDFNKAFNVKSPDKKFANDFIDARMQSWLLANAEGLSFEVVGDRSLAIAGKMDPSGFPALLATAQGFHDQVPAVVASLYPKGSG
jgi:hypothetical protein